MGRNFYSTFEEASDAFEKVMKKMDLEKKDVKIFSCHYQLYYKKDRLLPSRPEMLYKKYWKEKGGWRGFFKIEKIIYYSTFEEAAKALQNFPVVAQSVDTYKRIRKKDPRLPLNPQYTYLDFRKKGGWKKFLTI